MREDQRHKHEDPQWKPPFEDFEGALEGYETVTHPNSEGTLVVPMSVTTTKYIRKPLYVDAVRITEGNFEAIAAWCQGDIHQDEGAGKGTGKKFIKVRVHNPNSPRQMQAFVGDWLLYTERGYKIYTNKSFLSAFDEADSVRDDNSDFTVIGPECFAKDDGSVLSWRGQNYIPQEKVEDLVESQ